MVTQIISADERRKELQARASALGIDEDYISLLVDSFYTRIREDEMLGPIFNNAIKDNWDAHLAQMKRFWASVALNAGTYSGKPVPKHVKLKMVEPHHFDHWLDLFEQTLTETAPQPEAIPFFMERANRIANSLKMAMFWSINDKEPAS